MRMYPFLVILLISCVLAVELEVLLDQQINEAKCAAQCQSVHENDQEIQCREICLVVKGNKQSDLCRFPKLCQKGCKVACQKERVQPGSRIVRYLQKSCQLFWRLDHASNGIVFILAGKDQGDMWNVMANKLTQNTWNLNKHDLGRFTEVSIFAVSSTGVMDQTDLKLQPNHQCPSEVKEILPNPETVTATQEERQARTLYITLSVFLTILSIIFLMLVVFLNRKNKCCAHAADHTQEHNCSSNQDQEWTMPNNLTTILSQNHFQSQASNQCTDYEEILQFSEPFTDV